MFIQSKRVGAATTAFFAALLQVATAAHAETTRNLGAEAAAPVRVPRPALRRRPIVVSLIPVGSSVLPVGTPVGFKLMSSAAGYAHLYVLDASGKSQIWLENVPIRSRQPLVYPRQGLVVRASPPAGDDTLIFVVSRQPIGGFGGAARTETPADAQISAAAFRGALSARMAALPRGDWVFTETRVRVQD